MSYVVWGRQVTNDELWRWLHDIKEAKTGARQERNDEKVRIGSSSTQAKPSKANRRPIARCCHHDAVSSRRTLAPHAPLMATAGMWSEIPWDPCSSAQCCTAVAEPRWSSWFISGGACTYQLPFRCDLRVGMMDNDPFSFFSPSAVGMAVWVGYECGRAGTARPVVSSFILFQKEHSNKETKREEKKESTILLIVVLFAFVLVYLAPKLPNGGTKIETKLF